MHDFEAIYLASRGRHVNGLSKRKDGTWSARPSWHKREQKTALRKPITFLAVQICEELACM